MNTDNKEFIKENTKFKKDKYSSLIIFCLFVFVSLINQYTSRNILVSYATLSIFIGYCSYVYFSLYSIKKRKRYLVLSIATFIGTFITLSMYVLNSIR